MHWCWLSPKLTPTTAKTGSLRTLTQEKISLWITGLAHFGATLHARAGEVEICFSFPRRI
jgi:hypothetical protein